jgi:hypothetical protein
LARLRPRPATAAARGAGCFGGARRAAGVLAGRCARRLHCFGSAQAEARDGSSTSCWSLRRCVACCRRLSWPLCAAASLFWLGSDRGPRWHQHEVLVASAVRGVLPAPWPAALRRVLTLFWLGSGRGPRQQHEDLVLVASAVRGVLPAPWLAAVRCGLTVRWLLRATATGRHCFARRRRRPATRSIRSS